nr:hypothetical protein [Tanacetum cinerariifolium]
MAQQVILAAQLVPRFHTIGRCNNYAVPHSILCSPECEIVGQILLDHPLDYALNVTTDVPVVYLQQFWRTVSKVPGPKETIKFMLIPQRIEEDYHSIKDDIPLVSVYTTRDVRVRGMLISDAFLTEEIHVTNYFKEAHRTPTFIASPQGKKRKQIVGESSSLHKSLKITIRQQKVVESEKDDDSENRLEPGSHKENPEHIDDDDEKDKEKVDEEE